MRPLLPALALALCCCALPGRADACINSPRTKFEEREFRSRYKHKRGKKKTEVQASAPRLASPLALLAALGMSGVGLLCLGKLRSAIRNAEGA